jgi:heterotetrameric sarcosine oxidase gamma subunit
VSLAFLQVDAAEDLIARSPIADAASAAGAQFDIRDGWWVAASFGDPDHEREACRQSVGWADVSHLGKLELQGRLSDVDALPREPGSASWSASAWWCRLAPDRALVICEPGVTATLRDTLGQLPGVRVVDLTGSSGALCVAGPVAREVFARFCALDLRAGSLPVGGVRPGSVARTPGLVLRDGDERFLWIFGAAYGQYVWTVIDDAGSRLGGRPVGVDALPVAEPLTQEADARA